MSDEGKIVKKKRTNEEDRGKKAEKQKNVVMMACCPEGGDDVGPEKFKEEICLALEKGLGDRGNVVMTRLDDTDLQQIDALVEVEAFKSRSEAAAFFIKEGIQTRKDLFQKVMPTVEKIRELKEQAKRDLGKKEQQ